jgi:hypothetical protein
MIRYGLGKAVAGSSVPGWRLLLFVARRRRTPFPALLFATCLVASVAVPFHLMPARTVTVTVTVLGVDHTSSPISAIQVFAGPCLFAEATPSPAGGATFVLPPADYVVSARTDEGQLTGWAMGHVALHADRDLDVVIDHTMVPPSDLTPVRVAPPPPCAAR